MVKGKQKYLGKCTDILFSASSNLRISRFQFKIEGTLPKLLKVSQFLMTRLCLLDVYIPKASLYFTY
jgi:hypothetical protein